MLSRKVLNVLFLSVCSMTGGELFERIQQRGDSPFTERGRCYSHGYMYLFVLIITVKMDNC